MGFPKCRQDIRLERVGFEGGMKFRGVKKGGIVSDL